MATCESLLEALTSALGAERVSTDPEQLNRASQDTWPLITKEAGLGRFAHRPDVVARPAAWDHAKAVLAIAREHDVPVTVRSLASSVTGQPLATSGGVVMDIEEIPSDVAMNHTDLTVTVGATQPGGALESFLQGQGYTLGHSPQSLYRSTVGGWVATLATGQFSSYYGGIENLVVGYKVLLATGEHVQLTASPRAAMGPDLRQLFIGSEGTLGVITEIELKMFPLPPAQYFETATLPDVPAGIALMRDQAAAGLRPFLIRLYDADEARHTLHDSSINDPVLFLGTQGTKQTAWAEMEELRHLIRHHGGSTIGPEGAQYWMERRFDFTTIESILSTKGGYAETIEVAHRWSGIDELYLNLKSALSPLADEVFCHFSHVYTQGTSLYVILRGAVEDDRAAVHKMRELWSTVMDVCLDHGAELSHHHGAGIARSPYTRQSLGTSHQLLRRIKSAMDPNGTLNPGKLGL